MVELDKVWTDFKALADTRFLKIQYEEFDEAYILYATEESFDYHCHLNKDGGADVTDFETNYKSDANNPLVDRSVDGRPIVRAESRPANCTTVFTTVGDGATTIGDGNDLYWDFSNTDNDITAPTGYKRKRIEISFIDPVWIKEGTLYFHNTTKGSYIDVKVVCPNGEYYYDNDGNPQLAGSDTPISHYVNKAFIQGDCPMGDELNTESCSNEIPSNYKFWVEITVPDTDSTSNGYVQFELYRTRTVIL